MIVSRYADNFPGTVGGSLEILGGPIYPAQEVLTLVQVPNGGTIKAWTRKCHDDLQKLSFDEDDLEELIKIALTSGCFHRSECAQSSNGPWAACDSYVFKRQEWVHHANKEMWFDYYIKFAISKFGNLLLLVSCHLSENRR